MVNPIAQALCHRGLPILGTALILYATMSSDVFAQTAKEKSVLPPNYRQYVARAAAFWYIVKSKGPATISETPRPGGKRFCIGFPVPKMGLLSGHPTETQPFSFYVDIGRGIYGQFVFTARGDSDLFNGPCKGPSQPFNELNKLAAEVKACRAKGGGACGVNAFTVSKVGRELRRMQR